jgi:hypothetical protein
MSVFLDTRGNSSLAIGICGRCSRKFPIGELHSDPNYPGLMVCRADQDEFDPYRLPARQTENIALRYARPDTPLYDSDPVPQTPTASGIVLDFVNGEYTIDGVSVAVEEAIVPYEGDFLPSIFSYDDIVPGVGWAGTEGAGFPTVQLTTAAFEAIGSAPYSGTMTILMDVAAALPGPSVTASVNIICAPEEEEVYARYTRNFGSAGDELSIRDSAPTGDAAFGTPTGLTRNVPFELNFEYTGSSFSADVNGVAPLNIPVVTGAPTTITFLSGAATSEGGVLAIRRIEIATGVALIGDE